MYGKNSREEYFIKKTCAIMAAVRELSFKNRNCGGIFPGKRPQKPSAGGGGQGCCIISDTGDP
jgi:hypothetical protein